LAGSSYLKQVQAPSLLIVGSRDNAQVIAWNQNALQSQLTILATLFHFFSFLQFDLSFRSI